jgi:hypothetical protein
VTAVQRALFPSAWSDEFSRDRRHRYVLDIPLSAGPAVAFCGCNPSKASRHQSDATVRRWIGFARRWGYGRIIVVNLFALVSTDPDELAKAADPVGRDNDVWIRWATRRAQLLVACWGSCSPLVEARAAEVRPMLGPGVKCFGFNRDGSPRHPVRLPYATELVDYPLVTAPPPRTRDQSGRFDLDRLSLVCVCGHTLGQHGTSPPRACVEHMNGETACRCRAFRRAPASGSEPTDQTRSR